MNKKLLASILLSLFEGIVFFYYFLGSPIQELPWIYKDCFNGSFLNNVARADRINLHFWCQTTNLQIGTVLFFIFLIIFQYFIFFEIHNDIKKKSIYILIVTLIVSLGIMLSIMIPGTSENITFIGSDGISYTRDFFPLFNLFTLWNMAFFTTLVFFSLYTIIHIIMILGNLIFKFFKKK